MAAYILTKHYGFDAPEINFEKMSKYRKIKNPEWTQKYRAEQNIFYLISVDVGRLHD